MKPINVVAADGWQTTPAMNPNDSEKHRTMMLLYKGINGSYYPAYYTYSCKAFLDELIYYLGGGNTTMICKAPGVGWDPAIPHPWVGATQPIIVGFGSSGLQISQTARDFTRLFVHRIESRLGIRSQLREVPHNMGQSVALFRASKKWIESSHIFSLLTWAFRYAGPSYWDGQRSIDDHFKFLGEFDWNAEYRARAGFKNLPPNIPYEWFTKLISILEKEGRPKPKLQLRRINRAHDQGAQSLYNEIKYGLSDWTLKSQKLEVSSNT